jgi:DNA polymerase-4
MATFFHIDMDAFYASVEQLDHPWLKGKCVMVGGTSNRGVVSAASYEARKFGVHSAMPAFQARRKCPHGIFLPPRMARYAEVSRTVMGILRKYSPLVQVVSIDEAYLDMSGTRELHGSPEKIGRSIKSRILDATGLTCSVGIAPLKFLSKIASDLDKPDGLTRIAPEEVAGFIERLPIRKVPGVGEKTFAQLDLMGVKTLGDLNRFPEKILVNRFGKYGRRLAALAAGRDSSAVVPHSPHKSISSERTLQTDTDDIERLRHHLLGQSEEIARHLRKSDLKARTITLKLKHADFRIVTRSTTLSAPIRSSKAIYRIAAELLDSYPLKQKIRLIGVGTSGLTEETPPVQLDLFDRHPQSNVNWEKIDRAVDSIKSKFGKGAIGRAGLSCGDKK